MTAGGAERWRAPLLEELERTLDESRNLAHEREQRLVLAFAGAPGTPIVLFGAGNLGKRTLALLRAHGHDVAAFLDNEPSLWGAHIDGVPVLSPEAGSVRFAADGVAVVTIWRAEPGHDFLITRDYLNNHGWRRVESFIQLFWGFAADALPYITIDLPTRVLSARDDILGAAVLWSDERSLREYVSQIRWRLTGDFAALSQAEPDQYFARGLVNPRSDEVFIDCGAYVGDTLLDVASRVGSWRAYHAFEPDPASFIALQSAVTTLPAPLRDRVFLHQAATAEGNYTAKFNASGVAAASLSAGGTTAVDCVAIDDVLGHPPPTFIKMDIEGAEAAALAGARRVIAEARPLLAVAAYHRQADLWELSRLVGDMGLGYRLFLRPHAGEGFETVLYALPPDRLGNHFGKGR